MVNVKNLLPVGSICAVAMLSLVACGDKPAEVQATPETKETPKSTTTSENNATPESTVPADAPTFVMAVEKSYPPFVIQDANGLASGFDIDLMNAVAEKAQFNVNIVSIDWSGAFDGLKSGKYNILGSGVGINEERKSFSDFSTPYYHSYVAFATTNDDINSVKDMTGRKIGLQSGTAYHKTIVDNFGSTNTIDSDYPTFFLSCQAMLAKKEDACVGDVAYLQYLKSTLKDDKSIPEIKIFEATGTDKKTVAFAIQKGNSEVAGLVNSGLEEIKKDGTYDKIHKKWFGE